MKYILALIASITISCSSHKSGASNTLKGSISEELNLVLADNYGGTELQQIQVIRSAGELKKFFIGLNKTRKPGLAVPKIDFSKELVVIYCSGKTTEGDIPGLYMVSESDDKLTLGIKKGNTTPDNNSTAMLMPFGLYTMSFTEKEIVLDLLK